jgi:hypothetical protein
MRRPAFLVNSWLNLVAVAHDNIKGTPSPNVKAKLPVSIDQRVCTLADPMQPAVSVSWFSHLRIITIRVSPKQHVPVYFSVIVSQRGVAARFSNSCL